MEEASKETEEVASALMAAVSVLYFGLHTDYISYSLLLFLFQFHDKVGRYKDIMKKLDLDIF